MDTALTCKLTKFVPRHRHKVMLLAQQLLGSDVKAPVSSSEFMDYPRFYLFNTQTKGTKDIRMPPPRRKTACLVLHRCVLGRCPGPLSTAQGKPSLTTVRRSHCHGFALLCPTIQSTNQPKTNKPSNQPTTNYCHDFAQPFNQPKTTQAPDVFICISSLTRVNHFISGRYPS